MARLTSSNNVVYVLKPADHQAGVDGDSFNLGKMHGAAIVMQFGAVTGNAVLKVYSGATAGTKTTELTFKYRHASGDHGAANADQFGTETSSAALTLTAATYDNRTLVVFVDETSVGDAAPYITVNLSAAASALNLSAVAIGNPRYAEPASVI